MINRNPLTLPRQRLRGMERPLMPSEALLLWLLQPRWPVLASEDPLARRFIRAMLTGEPCEFIYTAGSTPGLPRTVKVAHVFHHRPGGRIYVAGYCPERGANRVYALDSIMIIHSHGSP